MHARFFLFGPSTSIPLLSLGLVLGCDEDKPSPVTRARSEAIVAAQGTAPAPAPAVDPEETKPEAPAAPRGPLCSSKPNTPLPRTSVSGLGAAGAPFAGGIPAERGPTWVNLWAAWCEPCKKEIPILFQFQRDLAQKGKKIELSFVSIDDDPRQLQAFLDEQKEGTGVRRTFWLKEGSERENWLPEAGLSPDPRLPVHLLIDREGNIVCRIEGSIEADDFAAVEKVFASL